MYVGVMVGVTVSVKVGVIVYVGVIVGVGVTTAQIKSKLQFAVNVGVTV